MSIGTMRAAVLRGARDVVVLDLPRPEPGPGEIVLRVDAALTCGTDAKVFRRGYHARMLTPPCTFGHEFCGTVAAVGRGVTNVRGGDAVVGGNSAPCGECPFCKDGREALCDDLLFANGAFAEWLLVPARIVARNLHPRPAGLDPVHAAATEPVAGVLKGLERLGPRPGESVALLGAGPIAGMFAALLANLGAPAVVLARTERAARTARAMRAAHVVVADGPERGRDELLACSPHGDGYDHVIEAAGVAATSQASPGLCRKGGRVLLFGGCRADVRVAWSPSRLHYEEIQVLSSFHHAPRHMEAALETIASGRLDLSPLLERPVDIAGVPAALEAMCDRTLRGKVPVVPGAPVDVGEGARA